MGSLRVTTNEGHTYHLRVGETCRMDIYDFILAMFTSCGDYAKTPLSNDDCIIKRYLK
jgi:hypothetical protein